jgi:BirA family transcriptional regulator, biotin operon repressor / biotin---[acetyl-CoA-carboxylase] ligase
MFDLGRIENCNLVAQIDYHEAIGSTSDRAIELGVLDESVLPLLVLAERQTAGRGRGANRWWSDQGALTFSLVLEAPRDLLPPSRWPQVALVAGVAVCEALQGLAPRAELRVKWPNDVYLADGKVCGILCESIPGMGDRLVVGIGVNVNNRRQETGDSGPRTTAASLVEHDGMQRDLTEVLIGVLDEMDRMWRQLLEGDFEKPASIYRERCFLTNRIVRIKQAGGSTIVGVCQGIDALGRLRVHTERGETAVVSGTVASWNG